jgi:hypothetical protein
VLAAVDRLVDAVAVSDAALAVVLARAHPYRERALGIDRDASGRERLLAVENGVPRGAGVGRLPHAAARDRDVPGVLVVRRDGDVDDAARVDGRADRAEREPLERRGLEQRVGAARALGAGGGGRRGGVRAMR